MNDETRTWFVRLLEQMEEEGFFGSLTFGYKAGRVYVIRKEETILPPAEVKTRELVTT